MEGALAKLARLFRLQLLLHQDALLKALLRFLRRDAFQVDDLLGALAEAGGFETITSARRDNHGQHRRGAASGSTGGASPEAMRLVA